MDIFEEFIAVGKLYNRNISVKSVLLMLSVLDITFDSHLQQYLKNSYLPTNNRGGTLKGKAVTINLYTVCLLVQLIFVLAVTSAPP